MKLKFAGFLRGLLRHVDEAPPARSLASAQTAAPAPAPATPVAPMPAPQPAAADAKEIAVPLASVIGLLPMDLRAKLMSTPAPGQTIAVPVEHILQQLAFGAVKISFGELRRLAPGLFANSGGEFDNRQINLPLQEVLARLNPAMLSRRHAQRVEVAEEVAGPFDGRGRGVTFTNEPLKPTEPEKIPAPAPVAFTPPPTAIPPRAVTPALSADTEVFTFKPRQTTPPASAPVAPPIPFPAPKPPTNGNGHSNGQRPPDAALPPFKFTTAPAPSAPVPSSVPRPEPAQSVLLVSLAEISENWPTALREEIQRSAFASADVPLPGALVDAGLKRGRITLTWQQVRTLVRPSSAASPHDALNLELPLKVIAPAFFAAQKTNGHQKKLAVAEEIPNLFFGFPQGTAATEAQPAPASADQKPADTNFFSAPEAEEPAPLRLAASATNLSPQTDFVNRHTHPQEVVARATALPGVAGAVVALADGLRVASHVPETLNADTVAAFLPQIFERVNQSTRELRMGALNNVGFTVGNVPWKIFRINSIYFAAFGKAGESLPKAQLAGLAAELDRKKTL